MPAVNLVKFGGRWLLNTVKDFLPHKTSKPSLTTLCEGSSEIHFAMAINTEYPIDTLEEFTIFATRIADLIKWTAHCDSLLIKTTPCYQSSLEMHLTLLHQNQAVLLCTVIGRLMIFDITGKNRQYCTN